MKKLYKGFLSIVVSLFVLVTITGCFVESEKLQISVTDYQNVIYTDEDITNYDFTKLFEIRVGGNKVVVTDDMLNYQDVDFNKVGEYTVTLYYEHEGRMFEKEVLISVRPSQVLSNALSQDYSNRTITYIVGDESGSYENVYKLTPTAAQVWDNSWYGEFYKYQLLNGEVVKGYASEDGNDPFVEDENTLYYYQYSFLNFMFDEFNVNDFVREGDYFVLSSENAKLYAQNITNYGIYEATEFKLKVENGYVVAISIADEYATYVMNLSDIGTTVVELPLPVDNKEDLIEALNQDYSNRTITYIVGDESGSYENVYKLTPTAAQVWDNSWYGEFYKYQLLNGEVVKGYASEDGNDPFVEDNTSISYFNYYFLTFMMDEFNSDDFVREGDYFVLDLAKSKEYAKRITNDGVMDATEFKLKVENGYVVAISIADEYATYVMNLSDIGTTVVELPL